MSILSAMSAEDLRFAILSGDSKAISKAPGIGNKSAERIILELKDKVQLIYVDTTEQMLAGDVQPDSSAKNEAAEALVSLGYTPAEAFKAINQIVITENMDSGAILKQALKIISTF